MEPFIETWEFINEFEGLYQISNTGRVKSIERNESYNRYGVDLMRIRNERILKQGYTKDGYKMCILNKGNVSYNKSIHRLVAEAFITNPENKPRVNHIDRNRGNNKVSNLEWATHEEDSHHGWKVRKPNVEQLLEMSKKRWRPVISININTGETKEYPSISEASRQTNISKTTISNNIRGEYKTFKYYQWKYK